MIKISNHKMRLLWLKSNQLQNKKTQKLDVLQIIKDLAFVQIDSIQNVTRAHHHIIWSRNKKYKEHMLDDLLEKKSNIFEHFTHDASVIPVEYYPIWKLQYKRLKEKIDKSKYYKNILDEQGKQEILNRVKNEGSLCSTDFENKISDDKKMWSKSAQKSTLDYMWYSGTLGTSHRKSFRKYYDLIENIIPSEILEKEYSLKEQVDWLCFQALDRLSVASAKEIKDFWDVLSIKEVNEWLLENKHNIVEVSWENSEGKYIKAYAIKDIENRIKNLRNTNSDIKIINPFDPAIRDRKRLKAIFSFEYKIEIFVPKAKRVWGYYVYPLLLGNKFIGRIELQANRKTKQMEVINFWLEDGELWDDNKQKKLEEELYSLASFVSVSEIIGLSKTSV